MLNLALLIYNATPSPTDFLDLLQIFTVSLQQAYNTLYAFDQQKTSFTYAESNFHVGNLQVSPHQINQHLTPIYCA